MTRLEQALDGKELPKNVALYRDENTGALEVRFWRFQPMLLFMIPFMCVWTYFTVGKMYVEPFLAGQPIRNAFFGIPFVLGALFFWGVIVLMLFGRGRLYLEHGRGRYVFRVLGLGFTRTFELHGNTDVVADEGSFNANTRGLPLPFGQGQSAVCIRNGYRSVRICHGWSSDAINFVCAMICQRKA